MLNSNKSTEFKLRAPSRFEKPPSPVSRNPVNFLRRPFPLLRRRMMSGRYPNTGLRQLAQPPYRQDCLRYRGIPPVRDFRYQSPPPPVFGMTLPTTERPPLSQQPQTNISNPRNMIFPFSQRPTTFNCNENKTAIESPESRIANLNGLNLNSEIWVETLTPDGLTYYYNARTRQTTYERPVGVQIIGLDQIKRLVFNYSQEHLQNLPNQNPSAVMKPPPYPYVNSFFPPPVNLTSAPRLTVFPSPLAVCNSPRAFTSSNESVRNPVPDYKVTMPPPVFPPPPPGLIPENLPLNSQNFNVQMDVSILTEANENSKQNSGNAELSPEKTDDCNEHLSEEEKISDWSVSDSNTFIQLSDNIQDGNVISEDMEKDVPEHDNKVSNIISEEESQTESGNVEQQKSPNNIQVDEQESSEMPEEKKSSEQTDKSRPTSSTPVPGTSWSVVWTGDEKVFFYDSQQKISVWKRPEELNNRVDVDKLIEKPPLLLNLKARRTSPGPDVKKLKKDNYDNDKCVENNENQTEIVEKETIKPEEVAHEDKIKLFREMLTEKKISAFSTWEKELHKIVLDCRYKLLASKERKQVYEAYILEKLEEEKIRRQNEMEQQRQKFRSLLEEADITPRTRFTDFAYRYAKDVRFKAIERIKLKENIFNQYVTELIVKQREKEKLKTEQKKKFIELLTEHEVSKSDSWSEIEKQISSDERYRAVQCSSLRERIFIEYILGCDGNRSACNKEERANASIRSREVEVKRDLSIYLKDREREQELHRHEAAVYDFKSLLNDLIRDSSTSWHSARKLLRDDHRYEFVHYLNSDEREDLFNEHVDQLHSKKKEKFRRMLDEMPTVTLTTTWNEIRKIILKDPRCSKFSSSERKCEKEFKEYLKEKEMLAINDFKELLKETKIITYKSKSLLNTTKHLKDIEEALSKDKRYLILDCIRNERKEILLSYIDKLHSIGPPPPPTATEPPYRSSKKKY